MKGKTDAIALRDTPTAYPSHSTNSPKSGILSERAAIIICSLGVAIFAIPILVFIQISSGLYWGLAMVYNLFQGSGLGEIDEI